MLNIECRNRSVGTGVFGAATAIIAVPAASPGSVGGTHFGTTFSTEEYSRQRSGLWAVLSPSLPCAAQGQSCVDPVPYLLFDNPVVFAGVLRSFVIHRAGIENVG